MMRKYTLVSPSAWLRRWYFTPRIASHGRPQSGVENYTFGNRLDLGFPPPQLATIFWSGRLQLPVGRGAVRSLHLRGLRPGRELDTRRQAIGPESPNPPTRRRDDASASDRGERHEDATHPSDPPWRRPSRAPCAAAPAL